MCDICGQTVHVWLCFVHICLRLLALICVWKFGRFYMDALWIQVPSPEVFVVWEKGAWVSSQQTLGSRGCNCCIVTPWATAVGSESRAWTKGRQLWEGSIPWSEGGAVVPPRDVSSIYPPQNSARFTNLAKELWHEKKSPMCLPISWDHFPSYKSLHFVRRFSHILVLKICYLEKYFPTFARFIQF